MTRHKLVDAQITATTIRTVTAFGFPNMLHHGANYLGLSGIGTRR